MKTISTDVEKRGESVIYETHGSLSKQTTWKGSEPIEPQKG